MKRQRLSYLMLVAVVVMTTVAFGVRAAAEEKKPAQAAEKIGVEDTFVRFAENEEGYVIVGYRTANEAVNQEWMLLDVGMTLQKGAAPQKITRDEIKLVTPDHRVGVPAEVEGSAARPSTSLTCSRRPNGIREMSQ